MLLIKNGNIWTGTGEVIERGSILVEKGKIKKIGKDFKVPEGTKVIDVRGRFVSPGLIDAHSHLGLWETAIGFEGSDGNEAVDPITPHLRAIDSINPMDLTFKEARDGGVTAVAAGPGSANVLGGTFAAIKTAKANRIDDLVIKHPVAMKCAFGENPKRVYSGKGKSPTTRMAVASLLRQALEKARQYMVKKEAANGDIEKEPPYDAKSEALLPVLKREIPLKAHAHRADDMFTAMRIAEEFNLDITMDHSTEGHLIVDELVKANAKCIVGPSFGHRTKFELQNTTFETPGILSKAGLKVAITTDCQVTPQQTLITWAATAVKYGMEKEDALKAVTINAAEIIGIADRVGSLEVGKDADIVVWNKHPLDLNTDVFMTVIDGKIEYKK